MRTGFVSIIGRPNAGKSTLLNRLAGQKLAIVTHKPQTTRNRITGIVNLKRAAGRPAAQIVFVDTPGVHKPGDSLNRRMMQEVYDALEGCNLLLLIVDITQRFGSGDEFVLEMLKQRKHKRVFLLLNKIDLVDKRELLPLIEQWSHLREFAEIIPISAAKGTNVDDLLTSVVKALPEGPRYFPEDQVTDQPERFIVAELIREQVLVRTGKEVPYAASVMVESFEEGARLTRIAAVIYVERDGQKAIIIGKHGAMLKEIGTRARREIERILGTKVYLELFVKVQPNWRESRSFVEEALDWRRQIDSLTPSVAEDEEEK